ncbi:polymorphic toxin-type HINT domain-containing protein [Streptomyces sp. NPDC056503]|uniref:polymorphic toxin-type HINT domain-containing protein n=1 Tax=Streptomyces sp. NPDC056503 TaxID=3345842 RepID=UPI00367C813E
MSTALATATAVALATAQLPAGPDPLNASPAAAAADPVPYDPGLAEKLREDQCRLNYVMRKGGQEMKAVARGGLGGTEAELHAAANDEYWKATPLATAFTKDRAWADAKMEEMNVREDDWQTNLAVRQLPPGYTGPEFQWPPDDPSIWGKTGIAGWIAGQFWQSESDFYADVHPSAGEDSVTAVTNIVNSRYYPATNENYEDRMAWEWDMTFMHPMRADDARLFLQYGGFPTSAPDPSTMEFRVDVENLKARFASCAWTDPPDPHGVLGAELGVAHQEWQSEIAGQKTQRDKIFVAEAQANKDLVVASQAMAEALGQSMIAGRMLDWEAYWLKADPDTTGFSYPTPAEFAEVRTWINRAQARAQGRLYVASRASVSAQAQAAVADKALQEAYAIADASGQPRGRGLMYGLQAAQIAKASAAATLAAAKATQTASDATRASAQDSKTLNALAETQSHATAAEFRRVAAQEAAAAAKAAADGAAQQATLAAQNAAKAKQARERAEAAEAEAKVAAADAKKQRGIAEAERDNAKREKELAESERAKAAAAEERAQTERQTAATALSTAQSAGATASTRLDEALKAEQKASSARTDAKDAERERDALSARAAAAEAYAAAVEGTGAAEGARAAATDARSAANTATTAAVNARAAANTATTAATTAREAATRATAAAERARAASSAAQRDVAITHAAVQKAHAAAADAIEASEAAGLNARTAKAYADTANAKAVEAKAHAAAARTEADAASRDSLRTAGYAYATAQAATSARDSAAQVIKPANDAIELGSPFMETDSSAGLAVLTAQAAKTAAEQQAALAKAKADQAAKAAVEAAALAAKAQADAKLAAEAASQAAQSAAAATASYKAARASAAAAEADAKAAVASEARTVEYDRQATADAAAAAGASSAADGYASSARSAADEAEQDAASARAAATAAESDAATARATATAAESDATAAESAAERAWESAREAQTAATNAEQQQDAQNQTVRMGDTGPSGIEGVVSFTTGMQDEISSDGFCTGTGTGGDIGCDYKIRHHLTGTAHFIVLTCPVAGLTAVECIGKYTADYIGSNPIDYSYDDTVHVNGWELTADFLKALATGFVKDFTDCAKKVAPGGEDGSWGGCAWAVGLIAAPYALGVAARSVVALRAALRSGVGVTEALAAVRASAIDRTALAALERLAASVANCFPAGTEIAVKGGTKKIEDIRVGDLVWSADPDTGERELKPVVRLFEKTVDRLVTVETGGTTVRATPDHPFRTADAGWTEAGNLHRGDRLVERDGGTSAVSSVGVEDGSVRVYNFEVADDHTYFVGERQLLVHNFCKLFPNKYPTQLAAELELAENLGIRPARPGTSAFDEFLDFEGSGDVIKWAVLEDGSLMIMPKVVRGNELSHPVLSGGADVAAAGEAQIVGTAETGYFGLGINSHSGHFFVQGDAFWSAGGGAEMLGREAFAKIGVQF